VIVGGGGIAGLCCAYELMMRGHELRRPSTLAATSRPCTTHSRTTFTPTSAPSTSPSRATTSTGATCVSST
jgi:glycine/D-amino acid oxidase-like deaminating enzyme